MKKNPLLLKLHGNVAENSYEDEYETDEATAEYVIGAAAWTLKSV